VRRATKTERQDNLEQLQEAMAVINRSVSEFQWVQQQSCCLLASLGCAVLALLVLPDQAIPIDQQFAIDWVDRIIAQPRHLSGCAKSELFDSFLHNLDLSATALVQQGFTL